MGAGFLLLPWCHDFHILELKHPLRRDALGEEELLERQPHELAVHEEVEGLRLVVRFGGGEEAVDDLGEAHAGEVGGDGDGGGRRPQWGRQLGNEAHAHLARGVGVHGVLPSRYCGDDTAARTLFNTVAQILFAQTSPLIPKWTSRKGW